MALLHSNLRKHHGGVAEWFRQGPAKPRTPVRFRSPPPVGLHFGAKRGGPESPIRPRPLPRIRPGRRPSRSSRHGLCQPPRPLLGVLLGSSGGRRPAPAAVPSGTPRRGLHRLRHSSPTNPRRRPREATRLRRPGAGEAFCVGSALPARRVRVWAPPRPPVPQVQPAGPRAMARPRPAGRRRVSDHVGREALGCPPSPSRSGDKRRDCPRTHRGTADKPRAAAPAGRAPRWRPADPCLRCRSQNGEARAGLALGWSECWPVVLPRRRTVWGEVGSDN